MGSFYNLLIWYNKTAKKIDEWNYLYELNLNLLFVKCTCPYQYPQRVAQFHYRVVLKFLLLTRPFVENRDLIPKHKEFFFNIKSLTTVNIFQDWSLWQIEQKLCSYRGHFNLQLTFYTSHWWPWHKYYFLHKHTHKFNTLNSVFTNRAICLGSILHFCFTRVFKKISY